ncbi:DegT/DnrJ/EryC1/StrS family aminotransferase [Marinifilum fragile]|uniref:DegT/DnrJ/EryC1/StrS family aminotransferase n=1 Tax=Marinifilum fragile TaxID=570161 RepID=UPI002AA93956|nr:DegT/DnrJ/EryC1/StrS family aminotransferase [Marinifilum fragile]
MENISMVDLKGQYERIKSEVDFGIQEVINNTAFINGPKVNEFAENLANYNRISHVIPCANGTDALQIALMALGLQAGDEVIVPVHTYVATAEVIALLNLEPVFVDSYDDLFTIDVEKIEAVIGPKTKAIVPVHLYGQCADMEPLLAIAKKHNLKVVEDTAQAIGAEYTFSDGRVMKAGTMGDIGTTSFFPSKNLGCYGDGGALLIADEELAKKAKMIANHGQSVKYHHDVIGCNSRLDTIQAAILDVKLKHLDEYSAARNKAADHYDCELANIKGLTIPKRADNSTHVFHQYTLRVANGKRDQVKEELQAKGIPSMIYYPIPLHLQKAYKKEGCDKGSFEVAELLSEEVLSLPIHTEMLEGELNYITDTLKGIMKKLD